MNHTIAFIGAGNIGKSLIGGLIADGYPANKIWASNIDSNSLNQLQQQYGIHISTDNHVAAQAADVIVLTVKPTILKTVIIELKQTILDKQPLVISVAAGKTTQNIQQWLHAQIAIVRCMPNTPALVSAGATGLYANDYVSDLQKTAAESILRAVGITVWLQDEADMDIVTALSGSGPAYFFLMIEALEEAAVSLGLQAEEAHLLTIQTALGAARMALESNLPVAELRRLVTSPGGTTESAIASLEQGQFKALLAKAVTAAKCRAEELAEPNK